MTAWLLALRSIPSLLETLCAAQATQATLLMELAAQLKYLTLQQQESLNLQRELYHKLTGEESKVRKIVPNPRPDPLLSNFAGVILKLSGNLPSDWQVRMPALPSKAPPTPPTPTSTSSSGSAGAGTTPVMPIPTRQSRAHDVTRNPVYGTPVQRPEYPSNPPSPSPPTNQQNSNPPPSPGSTTSHAAPTSLDEHPWPLPTPPFGTPP